MSHVQIHLQAVQKLIQTGNIRSSQNQGTLLGAEGQARRLRLQYIAVTGFYLNLDGNGDFVRGVYRQNRRHGGLLRQRRLVGPGVAAVIRNQRRQRIQAGAVDIDGGIGFLKVCQNLLHPFQNTIHLGKVGGILAIRLSVIHIQQELLKALPVFYGNDPQILVQTLNLRLDALFSRIVFIVEGQPLSVGAESLVSRQILVQIQVLGNRILAVCCHVLHGLFGDLRQVIRTIDRRNNRIQIAVNRCQAVILFQDSVHGSQLRGRLLRQNMGQVQNLPGFLGGLAQCIPAKLYPVLNGNLFEIRTLRDPGNIIAAGLDKAHSLTVIGAAHQHTAFRNPPQVLGVRLVGLRRHDILRALHPQVQKAVLLCGGPQTEGAGQQGGAGKDRQGRFVLSRIVFGNQRPQAMAFPGLSGRTGQGRISGYADHRSLVLRSAVYLVVIYLTRTVLGQGHLIAVGNGGGYLVPFLIAFAVGDRQISRYIRDNAGDVPRQLIVFSRKIRILGPQIVGLVNFIAGIPGFQRQGFHSAFRDGGPDFCSGGSLGHLQADRLLGQRGEDRRIHRNGIYHLGLNLYGNGVAVDVALNRRDLDHQLRRQLGLVIGALCSIGNFRCSKIIGSDQAVQLLIVCGCQICPQRSGRQDAPGILRGGRHSFDCCCQCINSSIQFSFCYLNA